MPADTPHSAWSALAIVARHHRLDVSARGIVHEAVIDGAGATPGQMATVAAGLGLDASNSRIGWDDLPGLGAALPFIAWLDNGNAVVVVGQQGDLVGVIDPLAGTGAPLSLTREVFCRRWQGDVTLIARPADGEPGSGRFGLAWFLPELLRQRGLMSQVAIAALLLHVLGLAVPIFFQLVIDKVLVHAVSSTLAVLTIGVVGALLFEALFGFVRQYLMIHATTRIDLSLSLRIFAHLLALPISFFDTAPTGILVKHLSQAERVREFLTGRLFTTLIDSTILVVLIPVLFLYSAPLALVVVGVSLVIGLIVFAVMPVFQRRLTRLYEVDGGRQALLVETINGMATAKALALEPRLKRDWADASAAGAGLRRDVARLAGTVQAVTGFLEKLMQVGVIAIGALLVFDATLTVGALVAFQMLAGRVLGPLSQLTSLVHEYQEVALAVRMLGEVMNAPAERAGASTGARPPIAGAMALEQVTFRYPGVARPALDRVSLSIPAGSIVGIVGRSGSGKTTLTRLIQGFHFAEEGTVAVDGIDIRAIDLAHLRQNIGTVLQESFLFRGTIRANIAMTRPTAAIEDVMAAADLAGATEFIRRLPQGFDTPIEEGGSNLSGGQRQRIAIARALLNSPPILVFDEATSALDPESETVIRRNMRRMAAGRTVLIVSHRLATLTDADMIIVVDDGRIADIGPHEALLTRCAPYRHLWQRQAA